MDQSWFYKQDVLGPIIAFLLTVVFVQWILPLLGREKRLAREKLKNFYNIAYAFITIREGFSIEIRGMVHNKNNCGLFHNFAIEGQSLTNIIYSELEFFNYALKNFDHMDKDLRKVLISYLRARGPDFVLSNDGCTNKELIRLRKQVEEKIIKQYQKYSKVSR